MQPYRNNYRRGGRVSSTTNRGSYAQIAEYRASHQPHLKRRRFSSPTSPLYPTHSVYPSLASDPDHMQNLEHQWSKQDEGAWQQSESVD